MLHQWHLRVRVGGRNETGARLKDSHNAKGRQPRVAAKPQPPPINSPTSPPFESADSKLRQRVPFQVAYYTCGWSPPASMLHHTGTIDGPGDKENQNPGGMGTSLGRRARSDSEGDNILTLGPRKRPYVSISLLPTPAKLLVLTVIIVKGSNGSTSVSWTSLRSYYPRFLQALRAHQRRAFEASPDGNWCLHGQRPHRRVSVIFHRANRLH